MRLILVAAALAGACTARGNEQEALLREAIAAYDRGVQVQREDAVAAADLYRDAARRFEALARGGVRNADLSYNLGNAYFRMGDTGRAVLHFRRALELAPRDAGIRANLDYARQRVTTQLESAGGRQLWQRVQFLPRVLSAGERWWLMTALSGGGWIGLLAWLGWRRAGLLATALTSIGLGLLVALSSTIHLIDGARRPIAVVVDIEPLLRHSRGDAGDPVRSEPLSGGVELRVLEERGDWVRVELLNGQSGWIPQSSIEWLE